MPTFHAEGVPPAPFVVGVGRSGTTLLRLMLDAHPELAIPAETHFVPTMIRRVEKLRAEGASQADLRAAALKRITTHPRFADWGITAEALETHLAGIDDFGAADAARAVHLVHAAECGKPRWGDKTPGYVRRMGPIAGTLAEARFLHVIRDGRDVAVSLRDVRWGTGDPSEAARLWGDGIRAGRSGGAELGGDRYLELRYEDLVTAPEGQVRRAAEFCELEWDERMLVYHSTAAERLAPTIRDVRMRSGLELSSDDRRSQHALVNEPPHAERVGRWRDELSAADRTAFEEVAGELLEQLGYPMA